MIEERAAAGYRVWKSARGLTANHQSNSQSGAKPARRSAMSGFFSSK